MYVTVSFIMSMMKLQSFGFEKKNCVLSYAVEYSLLQLFKPTVLLSVFMCTEETIGHMKSYSQLSVHKSASQYENQHTAT